MSSMVREWGVGGGGGLKCEVPCLLQVLAELASGKVSIHERRVRLMSRDQKNRKATEETFPWSFLMLLNVTTCET